MKGDDTTNSFFDNRAIFFFFPPPFWVKAKKRKISYQNTKLVFSCSKKQDAGAEWAIGYIVL